MKHVTAVTQYIAPVKQKHCGFTSEFTANNKSAVEFHRC